MKFNFSWPSEFSAEMSSWFNVWTLLSTTYSTVMKTYDHLNAEKIEKYFKCITAKNSWKLRSKQKCALFPEKHPCKTYSWH